MNYIQRSLEPTVLRANREFPVLVLTGPRQSGKTTLLKHLFGDTYHYVSLEAPDIRNIAIQDPRGFLEAYTQPVIFDEVQYVPELFSYIKEKVDAKRELAGQYILTGSQNLLLMERITESLVGRAAILKLLPLTWREIKNEPQLLLPWQRNEKNNAIIQPVTPAKLWESFLRGNFPELIANPERDSNLWFSSYIQTYLERDIRLLRQIENLTIFQNFLRLLAARSGQLLNLSQLGRDLGLTVNTVKSWISILETTFQIVILRPYFNNFGKRLVKTPKVYFTDVGVLCHLVGLKNYEHAAYGPMAGAIFETAVVSEIFKTYLHQGVEPQMYFWRTSDGDEVDLVIATENGLVPIEIKSTTTVTKRMADGIKKIQEGLGKKVTSGYVIYPGEYELPLIKNVTTLPLELL